MTEQQTEVSIIAPPSRRKSSMLRLRHANLLNQAREDLTRDQRRVLYLCLKYAQHSKWPDDDIFMIESREYADTYGLVVDEATRDIKAAIAGFKGKSFRVVDDIMGERMEGEIDWTPARWSSPKRERGVSAVQLNPLLRRYLLPVLYEKNFTITFLDELKLLRTKYSQRLYACLAQYRRTGRFYTTDDALREQWSLPASYNKWSMLKKRVLDPAIEECLAFDDFRYLTLTATPTSQGMSLMFAFTPCDDD